jgi:hypothetical protein
MSFSFRPKLAKYPLIWHKQSNFPSSPWNHKEFTSYQEKVLHYTDTKGKEPFPAPSWVSLIKLFLAWNMFPLYGLLVYLSQPAVFLYIPLS